MDSSRARIMYFVVLLGAAVALPYLLTPPTSSPPPSAHKTAPKTPASPTPKPAAAAIPEHDQARFDRQQRARITTDHFTAEVGAYNGGLTSFRLAGKRFRSSGKAIDLVSTDRAAYLPLAVEVDGLPPDQDFVLTQLSERSVELRRQSGSLYVSRKLEAGKGPYQLWVTTDIQNRGTEPSKVRLHLSTHHYVTREAEGATVPLIPVQASATSQGLCRHGDELERERDLLAPQRYADNVAFTGVENVYFLSAVAPDKPGAESCRIAASERGKDAEGKPIGSLFSAHLEYATVELAPGAGKTYRTLAYLGPKSPAELAAAGHSLKEAIATGWFTTLAEGLTFLLGLIYRAIGNWGVAIILLTFVVKTVLFPLTMKQMQSMARMKELKPELDRINELYGDDREKKGAAIMELYRKRGVNPMAGCFPVLLQLPIWFSLYASLSSNVELFHAPFALYWTDLSSPDRYFLLPVALGALMFVQQKMSPAAGMDPVQQKMMLYMMPAMMTSFMLFLPSGLCLYMLTNSALSIGQQRLIEAHLKRSSSQAQSPLVVTAVQEPATSTASPGRAPKSVRPSKAERRWRRGKR